MPRVSDRRTRLRRGAAVAMALAALSSLAVAAEVRKPGDAAAGKKIFMVKCVPCHKADGTGGVKLTGNPTPNWRDPKRWQDPKYTDDYFRDCITNGKVKSGMISWKTQLKPGEIEDLIAHIRTFEPKKK